MHNSAVTALWHEFGLTVNAVQQCCIFISVKERGRTKQSVCLGPEQPPAHSR